MKVPSPPPPARGLPPIYGDVWELPKNKARPVKAPPGDDPITWTDIAKVSVIAILILAVLLTVLAVGIVIGIRVGLR